MFPAARVVTVGAAPECAVRLEDEGIAPRHAVLYVEGGKLMIADAAGGAGVTINGKAVSSGAVTGLDDIRIGEYRLKLELIPPAGAEATTAKPSGPPQRRDPLGTRPIPPIDPEAPPERAHGIADDLLGSGLSPAYESPTQRLSSDVLPTPAAAPVVMQEEEPTRKRPAMKSMPPPPPPVEKPASLAPKAIKASLPPKPASLSPDKPSEKPRASVAPSERPRASAPPKKPEPVSGTATTKARSLPAPPPPRDPTPITPPREDTPPPYSPAIEAADEEEEDEELGTSVVAPQAHDDDDDDDEDFQPPFSLLDNVVRDRFKTPIRAESEPVVEVIRYKESRLLDVARVPKGDRFRYLDAASSSFSDLLRLKKNGRARLFYGEGTRGNVVIAGETTAFSAITDEAHKADKKGKLFVVELGEGDFAHIKLDAGEGYLVRFVRPPRPPPKSYRVEMTREDRVYGFTAFLAIVMVFVAIWVESLISPPELFAMEEEIEFAEVSLKDLELEKPEPTPTPTPEPEPTPTPTPEATPPPAPPAEKPEPPKREKRKSRSAPSPDRPPPTEPPPVDRAAEDAASALAALDNIAPRETKSLSAAVSNIAAVRVPNGTAKRFAVSGPIGKLPGNEVVLTTGSSGRDTRAAARLLEGKDVAAMAAQGGGKVRGTVAKVPARAVGTTGGSLSREEILKVVNEGISDIQRCYERELMKTPGLDGKVVMDWIIAPNGTVQSTRVRSSTLRSEAVTACIGGVIKGWQFPKPVGGSVTVTFPFTFRGQNF